MSVIHLAFLKNPAFKKKRDYMPAQKELSDLEHKFLQILLQEKIFSEFDLCESYQLNLIKYFNNKIHCCPVNF